MGGENREKGGKEAAKSNNNGRVCMLNHKSFYARTKDDI